VGFTRSFDHYFGSLRGVRSFGDQAIILTSESRITSAPAQSPFTRPQPTHWRTAQPRPVIDLFARNITIKHQDHLNPWPNRLYRGGTAMDLIAAVIAMQIADAYQQGYPRTQGRRSPLSTDSGPAVANYRGERQHGHMQPLNRELAGVSTSKMVS
jgi:hypothetical protein